MWFRSLFASLKYPIANSPTRSTGPRARRRRPVARLRLECLEDRTMPSFLAPVNYAAGQGPTSVTSADFNNDHIQDLVVCNYQTSTVSVLLGKGDGTFQAAQTFATGTNPNSVAVGDFNGDGKIDIVTGNKSNGTSPGTMSVLLGNGDGTFRAPINFTLQGQSAPGSAPILQNPRYIAVGDMNHDGRLDLVVTGLSGGLSGGSYSYTNYVNVLLGNGDGTFATANTYLLSSGYAAGKMRLADFNGDGNLDIAALTDSASVSVMLGKGDGTLRAPTSFVTVDSSGPQDLAVGDFNGDGKLDLVTANYAGGVNGGVSVLLGNGDGSFQAPINTPLPSVTPGGNSLAQAAFAVTVGDLNGDGKLDLAVTGRSTYSVYSGSGPYGKYYNAIDSGNVYVLVGHGDGTFTNSQTVQLSSVNPYYITTGNFNGDTFPDLAVGFSDSNNLSVLLNAADWSTTPQASSFSVSGFPSSTMAGVANSFTVTAKNADGTTAAGYTGTVHFTSTDGQAVLPADYTFTAADAGVHTFSATLETAATQLITATDTLTLGLTGSETGITVSPAAASHLGIAAPAGSTAGSAFNVTVTALDPYNNTATGYTGAVHFTSSDGQAVLPGNYTFTAADNGVHTFSNGVTLKTAGSQTVTAADAVTISITGGATVALNSAAASTMSVAGFPSVTTAGAAHTFTVTLRDPYGNIASGYSGTVHFTSSDAKAALPANYTFTTADAGVHTFSATLKTAGTQSITVADTTTASLTGTDGGITVNAAAASQFIITAPTSVQHGVAFSLTLTVEDAYGNVVTGYTGTVHFSSTDNKATLPANYTFTAADNGVHTFTGLILRKTGTQKITLTDTLNSSLTGSVTENVL